MPMRRRRGTGGMDGSRDGAIAIEVKRLTSVRGFSQRLEDDEPALAVRSRSARQRGCERQAQRRDLPPLLGAPALHVDAERLQQVVRRFVIAMLVANAG